MQLTNVLMLAFAGASVSAGSVHHHHHTRRDYVRAVKGAPGSVVPAPVPSATAPVADDASSVEADLASEYEPFCSGSASSKRATVAEIAYAGNLGTADNYGCNMKQIRTSLIDEYDYSMKITNVADETYEVICWNKIGRDGGINGFFKGMGESVTISLPAGETASVAFDSNTQGACAFAPGSLPASAEGCYQGTWAEFDFANASNNDWSGADCSALTSEDTGGKVVGCKLCDKDDKTCSTIYSDGTGVNAYTAGTNDLDGVGLNTVPGAVTYYLDIGHSK